MRLLVSVRDAHEAVSAVAGGADIIDAKEPATGAIGAVSLPTLADIIGSVGGVAPVSAALGEADDEGGLEESARECARLGVAFVKVAFGPITSANRLAALLAAALAGVSGTATAVVAVAYADYEGVGAAPPDVIADAATAAGAHGMLLDTAIKQGRGLLQLSDDGGLRLWVRRVHNGGMFAALAGRLDAAHLARLGASGADIIGVRGAACEGGRLGRVSPRKVHALSAHLRAHAPS